MSVEAIGAIFTGIASVIVALGSFIVSRSRRSYEDIRVIKKDFSKLQRRFRAAMRHIFNLEVALEGAGKTIPARPEELDVEWDEEEEKKSSK
jgi:hypothetical protein